MRTIWSRASKTGVGFLAVVLVIGAATATLGGTVHAVEVQSNAQDLATIKKAFGITFIPISVGDGQRPVLPSGALGLTLEEALNAAMQPNTAASGPAVVSGRPLPNVQVTAQYGMFTDDQAGMAHGTGKVVPFWQNKPVWIVTFAGPGVQAWTHGRARRVRHEVNVVIDAENGKYLEAYVYR